MSKLLVYKCPRGIEYTPGILVREDGYRAFGLFKVGAPSTCHPFYSRDNGTTLSEYLNSVVEYCGGELKELANYPYFNPLEVEL